LAHLFWWYLFPDAIIVIDQHFDHLFIKLVINLLSCYYSFWSLFGKTFTIQCPTSRIFTDLILNALFYTFNFSNLFGSFSNLWHTFHRNSLVIGWISNKEKRLLTLERDGWISFDNFSVHYIDVHKCYIFALKHDFIFRWFESQEKSKSGNTFPHLSRTYSFCNLLLFSLSLTDAIVLSSNFLNWLTKQEQSAHDFPFYICDSHIFSIPFGNLILFNLYVS
jgi:hypothetical protein